MGIKDIFSSLGNPLKTAGEAFKSRNEKKMHEKTLEAKIIQQRESNANAIDLSEKEWEVLQSWQQESTWKDEYVTVSIVAIFNIIVLGGLAQAFGFPQLLEGIRISVETLNDVMVSINGVTGEAEWTPMGVLISVTIYAAIGVYGWKKLF